ncbi:MAG: hypothetical protein ACYSWO_29295 [Planctomycetota bacterium]|jgi:hypothetical protein
MRRTCWLSVDFDFFVRSLIKWDWSQGESTFFQSGPLWQVRAAQFLMQGMNLRDEMDPDRYANPAISEFWHRLQSFGYDFSNHPIFVIGDSHAGAAPLFDEVARTLVGEPADILINFDAHHDLGYREWAQTSKMIADEKCTCDMWLSALMEWWPQLKSRIVFPDWAKADFTIQKQITHVGDHCPGRIFTRVEMDFYSGSLGPVSDLVCHPHEQLDVQAIFVCRSSAWVPPWLDRDFAQFVHDGEELVGSKALNPSGVSPMDPRADFDFDEVFYLSELWKQAGAGILQPPESNGN